MQHEYWYLNKVGYFAEMILVVPGGADTDEPGKDKEEFRSLHSVSMYIIENVITFIDFFQQLGLLWALSVLVDFPKDFLRGSM